MGGSGDSHGDGSLTVGCQRVPCVDNVLKICPVARKTNLGGEPLDCLARNIGLNPSGLKLVLDIGEGRGIRQLQLVE